MKMMIRAVCVVALAVLLFWLSGCGGNTPKALAKEACQMYADGLKMVVMAKKADVGEDIGMSQQEALELAQKSMKRMADFNKKVEALSPEDRAIFEKERDRLMQELNKPFLTE
jgi:hypothetical protein